MLEKEIQGRSLSYIFAFAGVFAAGLRPGLAGAFFGLAIGFIPQIMFSAKLSLPPKSVRG